jgi:2-hydroxy-6-oxonona-2,4-dienedioate hydrolase
MQEKFIKIDENKIRYLEAGASKSTIVLIHGLGASAERWEYVIPLFNKNYRVIVPDLIGFGYSDKPLVDYTTDFFSNFLANFLEKIGLEKTNIIGSSLGGQISAEYAYVHKDSIGKLVLVSPSGAMNHSTPALDAYVMAALYPDKEGAENAYKMMAAPGQNINPKIIEDFVTRMKLPNAKMAFMSTLLGLKNAEDIITKLKTITIPSLIIWGERDPVIPIKYADSFVSSIQDCRFYRMDGCGHTPYVDEPEKFAKIVLDFLDGN